MTPETAQAEDLHPQSKMEQLTDDVKSYVTTLFELSKLKLVDKISAAGASITAYVALALLGLLVLILFSIGAATLINAELNSAFLGYFIVAGAYLLIGLLIVLTQNNAIKKPVSSAIIKSILSE
ncbi:MAG: phage holin family protein [Bacteroidota bacterium]